jgi:small conductance mechanosensitive channel
VLILIRKPFRPGTRSSRTGEHEGTVDDIDLRVTRLIDYDGEIVLIPNADVFTEPLTTSPGAASAAPG